MMKRLLLFILLFLPVADILAQNPTIVHVGTTKSPVKIFNALPDSLAQIPRFYSFDVVSGDSTIRKCLLSWSLNYDEHGGTIPKSEWTSSTNDGVTWASRSMSPEKIQMGSAIRRNSDGVIITIPFNVEQTIDHSPFTFTYQTSADNGTTWTEHFRGGTVTGFGSQTFNGFRFHRGIIQDADGTLYAPAYLSYKTDSVQTLVLMMSTDGGVTWDYRSEIQHTANVDYGETSIVRCKNGSILAVIRSTKHYPYDAQPNELKVKRSTDNGLTWGAITFIWTVDANHPDHHGCDPNLFMMPNGVLVLSYGDDLGTNKMRDNYLAFSPDGNGTNWVNVTKTYASVNSLGNKSSGYTSILPTRNSRLLQVTDRGQNWAYDLTPFPSPSPFSIWTNIYDLVLDYRNRIDLRTPAGQSTITTDMTYTNATHPETAATAAYDGSTDYWSSAMKMSSSGTYTIDLKDTLKRVNAMAICLLKGVQQSATISWSKDSINWTTIKTYSNVTHETVDYTSFSPINARYVRAVVTGSTKVGITEFSLFRTADTFEDYQQGLPQDYVASATNPGFWVSEANTPAPTGYKSHYALYMDDENSSDIKQLSKTAGFSSSATKTFDFKIRTKNFYSGGCIQFRLVSGSTNVFRMAVFSNGTIKYYNGSSWLNVNASAVVPLDTWKGIRVIADAPHDTAAIYVDGTYIGKAHRETTTASAMNGFLFSSSGSAAVGDKAFFDDVDLYSTATGLAAKKNTGIDMISVVNTSEDDKSGMKVVVSPNPADALTKISVTNTTSGKIQFYISNTYGKIIKKIDGMVEGKNIEIMVPIQELPVGVYIVTVKQNNQIIQTKLIK